MLCRTLFVGFAEVAEATFVALGAEGGAGVATVEDEPMVGIGNLFLGIVFGEHSLY